ncbi:hypothetical protein [Patulibacter minatonensis]|uniref:hypothetical protein n=1 Tax=Patulibacter minatonensis TaxID=298163 RepID=UPI0004790F87|nr:hypothetical protein [Patulibacter minatonensis]
MSAYVLGIGDYFAARRPDGVVLDGSRVRVVWADGEMRVQRYASASSSSGEGWGDYLLASSDGPAQALIDLIARASTSRATEQGQKQGPDVD